MRALIVDGRARAEIDRIVDYAEKHPLSTDDLLDIINGRKAPPGDSPRFRCHIPHGYRIVYSVEFQNNRKLRHLSVSVDQKKKAPSIPAVEMIMSLIPFKRPLNECSVAVEDLGQGMSAINVIEDI